MPETPTDRCEHGDIRAACLDCLNETPAGREPKPVLVATSWFNAMYPGHCRGCNLPIHEGQRVARLSNETYVHEGCAP